MDSLLQFNNWNYLLCVSTIVGCASSHSSALNEYDMVIEEDEKTNRLMESLKLWNALTSSQYMSGVPFVLVLNKCDLFREKIKTVPLQTVFDEYRDMEKRIDPANVVELQNSSDYINAL